MNTNMRSALIKIDAAITSRGGEALVVGGAVRDMITGIDPKDVDLMIRRLPLTEIAEIISNIGKSVECGQSFGIVKGVVNGIEFDFAIPRTSETKTGDGHADFSVVTDPFATAEMDLSRRDFACNAMAIPVEAFVRDNVSKIIDPHGGHIDIHCKLIRAVGNPTDRFREDPLRMLRAIQFATRMGFKIHTDTFNAIRANLPLLKTVSGERVLEEFKKAWVKGSENTENFVNLLHETGVGTTLFGDDFKPNIVFLRGLSTDNKVSGMMVAFFINGGNMTMMKPETNDVKLVELARKIRSSSEHPHTFIGNMKDRLHIIGDVFMELNTECFERTMKMMTTAITSKELEITGEELMSVLGVSSAKDGRKIGDAQRKMLTAIWLGEIVNSKKILIDFASKNCTVKAS